MAEDKVKDDVEIGDAEVAPLSDDDLGSVAGGGKVGVPPDCTNCGSTGCCTTGTDVGVD